MVMVFYPVRISIPTQNVAFNLQIQSNYCRHCVEDSDKLNALEKKPSKFFCGKKISREADWTALQLEIA